MRPSAAAQSSARAGAPSDFAPCRFAGIPPERPHRFPDVKNRATWLGGVFRYHPSGASRKRHLAQILDATNWRSRAPRSAGQTPVTLRAVPWPGFRPCLRRDAVRAWPRRWPACGLPARARCSGKKPAQLRKAIAALQAGDVLMVTRLDRLARSTRDLLNTLAAITGGKAGFRSLGDAGPTPRRRMVG